VGSGCTHLVVQPTAITIEPRASASRHITTLPFLSNASDSGKCTSSDLFRYLDHLS
jgi:hypothetical protein